MGTLIAFPLAPRSVAFDPLGAGAARGIPAPAPALPPAVPLARASLWTVMDLAHRLALDRHTPRVVIEKLRALAAHAGLPMPVNPRIIGGRPATGTARICAASLWDKGQVLAWLDNGGTTPAAHPPVTEPERKQRTREMLNHRAAALLGNQRQRRAGA